MMRNIQLMMTILMYVLLLTHAVRKMMIVCTMVLYWPVLQIGVMVTVCVMFYNGTCWAHNLLDDSTYVLRTYNHGLAE